MRPYLTILLCLAREFSIPRNVARYWELILRRTARHASLEMSKKEHYLYSRSVARCPIENSSTSRLRPWSDDNRALFTLRRR